MLGVYSKSVQYMKGLLKGNTVSITNVPSQQCVRFSGGNIEETCVMLSNGAPILNKGPWTIKLYVSLSGPLNLKHQCVKITQVYVLSWPLLYEFTIFLLDTIFNATFEKAHVNCTVVYDALITEWDRH